MFLVNTALKALYSPGYFYAHPRLSKPVCVLKNEMLFFVHTMEEIWEPVLFGCQLS